MPISGFTPQKGVGLPVSTISNGVSIPLDGTPTLVFVTNLGSNTAFINLGDNTQQAITANVVNDGAGYVVNEEITLAGGTFTTAAVIKVLTVNAGNILTYKIKTAGVYTVLPANPVAQGSTTGIGSGATFNMTWDYIAPTATVADGFPVLAQTQIVLQRGTAGSISAITASGSNTILRIDGATST